MRRNAITQLLRVKPHWVTRSSYGRWRFWLCLVAPLAIGCVPPRVPEPQHATNGPVCEGATYAADAPCLEKGEAAPFGGLLLRPQLAKSWLAAPVALKAENESLLKSNAFDVGLVAGAVVLIGTAFVAGYELGHTVK